MAVMVALSCSGMRAKEATFLLPSDFEGPVVILFGQKSGIGPDIKDERLLFSVPERGLIKTSVNADWLTGMPKFFVTDNVNNRTELKYLFPGEFNSSNQDTKSVQLYSKGTFNSKSGVVKFMSFLVCKPKEGELYAARKNQLIVKARQEIE